MRPLTIFTTLLLLAAACTGVSETTAGTTLASTTTSSPTSTTTTSATTTSTTMTTSTTTTTTTTMPPLVAFAPRRPRAVAPFAGYRMVPMDVPGAYQGPAWPTSLGGVVVPPDASYLVDDPTAVAALTERGFVVVPGWMRLFQDVYGPALYDNHAMFITTDVGYHFLHLAFSKVLRDTEQDSMLPVLEDLVSRTVSVSRTQAAELEGTDLDEVASRVEQLFEAAAVLLGLDVGPVGPRAEQEVELAREAVEMTTSPISGFVDCDPTQSPRGCVDYSQFKPRGHYTRNEDLERYFRAMSVLGQEGAAFVDSSADGSTAVDVRSMQFGLLMARAMQADPAIITDWRLIYEPTAFMVGLADDYTPYELLGAAGDWTVGDLGDPVFLQGVADRLLASRSVGINPEAASVRVMGARFVIDSYILDQLAWPNVGEESPPEKRRVFVSALDVAAAMGSDHALEIQRAAGEDRYLHYEDQMAGMRNMIESRSDDEWAVTVYDAWLAALQPVWRSHGEAFPPFMRTDAWTAKDLNTGLGSYVELKHDTILYGKQEFAAEGGGDWSEFPPRHWVEPDPVAFERMVQVAGMLQEGLDDRGLLTDANDQLLDDLGAFLTRLARIARDELAAKPISDADNDWLGEVGTTLERLWYQSADVDPASGAVASGDTFDALVADIGRSSFEFLEVGTGLVDNIYVLVPADDGRMQIAIGGVYSYYEFWRPDGQGRLTDEEWRAKVSNGETPDRFEPTTLPGPDGGSRERPAWQTAFLVPTPW